MGRKGQLECEHEAKLLASFGEILVSLPLVQHCAPIIIED